MEESELPFYSGELIKSQKPSYLLICCSDSRMPKGELLTNFRFRPGEVFTVSNAGNCYIFNRETVYYGVEHLKVENLLICAHSSCGMMKAVIEGGDDNPYISGAVRIIRDEVFGGVLPCTDVDELAMENVHRQIDIMENDEVISRAREMGSLRNIVGLYYDFTGGKPELYLINTNGRRIEEKLKWDELRSAIP